MNEIFPFYDEMIKNASEDAIFVEIGVLRGDSLLHLAKKLKGKQKAFGIDPWSSEWYSQKHSGNEFYEKDDGVKNYITSTLKLKEYPITLIRLFSYEAISLFDDKSLFCVFIDGNHEKDAVKRDIELYYPKIKMGGFLAGHDFQMASVKEALRETKLNFMNTTTLWKIFIES